MLTPVTVDELKTFCANSYNGLLVSAMNYALYRLSLTRVERGNHPPDEDETRTLKFYETLLQTEAHCYGCNHLFHHELFSKEQLPDERYRSKRTRDDTGAPFYSMNDGKFDDDEEVAAPV